MQKKMRVAIVYGGRSGEHEVSLRSAASVFHNLDREKYETFPIAISKDGRWSETPMSAVEKAESALPVVDGAPNVYLAIYPGAGGHHSNGVFCRADGLGTRIDVDVIFPVMHGTFSEDGTIQGLFELAEIPYVGCGVLASAAAMDKELAKRIVRDAGLPIVPYISVKTGEWSGSELVARVSKELGFPVFVKPSNLGSSVGVHRVKDPGALEEAVHDAFRYDTKVLIEKAVNAREIELAVLENPEIGKPPMVSVPGEVAPTHEFYSYEAKYLDENGAALMIPAKLDEEQIRAAQKIARSAFQALECEGLSRCDLFMDKKTGEFYFNEVNTLPGFTSISMYPKLWEKTGIPYKELLSRLIDLAVARHARKKELVREFRTT